jgi:hypothetical protein
MKRRNFIQRIFAAAAALFVPRRARAQQMEAPMRELAALVLPVSLGRARTDKIASDFLHWILDYKPGAEMSSGYGSPRTQVVGPNPSAQYADQLNALGSPIVRGAIEKALADAMVDRIPPRPNGRHVAADLVAFFFASAEGEDFLYGVAIRRDDCRGLGSSGQRPARLR